VKYRRTIAALIAYDNARAAFHELGPKPQRTLDGLAFSVRDAYWLDVGGDSTARPACIAMTVEEVRQLVLSRPRE
jgi:hypothetical protein